MKKTQKRRATITELMQLFDRSRPVIHSLVSRAGLKKTDEGYLISEVMAAHRESQARDSKHVGNSDLRQEQIRLENRLLEIKISQHEGKLVDAEQVEQDAMRCGTAIRNDLLALPQSLAPRLANKTDLAEIVAILDPAIRDCLRHLSDTLE